MAREFKIKTVTSTESIADLHIIVTTTFQDLLADFTYAELLESDDLNGLLSSSNIVTEDENSDPVNSFGNVQPPTGGGIKGVLLFGAKSDDTGKLLIANGKSSDGDDSTKAKTRQPISEAGTITKLAYKTKDGSTSTQMKIHINGVVEATVVLSSMNANNGGVESISVSVSAGDYVEIEYDGSQKPGECTMSLTIE